jgi:hypothetical protein
MREFDEVAAAFDAADAAMARMSDAPMGLVDSLVALAKIVHDFRGHVVIPAPQGIRDEYGVVWHGSEQTKRERVIRMHERQFPSRVRAVERAEAMVGILGVTCYTIQRRRHYYFAEGTGLDYLTTEWVDDDDNDSVGSDAAGQDPHTEEGNP